VIPRLFEELKTLPEQKKAEVIDYLQRNQVMIRVVEEEVKQGQNEARLVKKIHKIDLIDVRTFPKVVFPEIINATGP